MFILSRQLRRTESRIPNSDLIRQINAGSGGARVDQKCFEEVRIQKPFADYTVSLSNIEETIEKQTENRFYTLAKSGLSTEILREKARKQAESEMQIFPNMRMYGHWFIPPTDFRAIIAARRALKIIYEDMMMGNCCNSHYTQQISSLLGRVHPELAELFKGDEETNFQTQAVLFDEYDYTAYKLSDGVFDNLRLYMRVYYPEDYKRLFFECKTTEDLNKATMDFIRDKVRNSVESLNKDMG